jgi:Na+/melibiose symporter-like transporter
MVLGFESFIIFFATLVAFGTNQDKGLTIWLVGLSLVFAFLVTPALLGPRWSYYWGSALQLMMLAAAFFVPASSWMLGLMLLVGIIFIGLWTWGMIAGATIDKARAVLERSQVQADMIITEVTDVTDETKN